MDLRQLRALIAVAETHSFSAAARSLHTVQSNISTHVARLERELEAELFDRRSGELTPEGEAVVERGRRILGELDAIDADVAAMRDDVRGVVRAGIIGTTARWLLPYVLDALKDDYPNVHLVVVDATTASLAPRLVAGDIDVAVIQLPLDNPDIDTGPLFEEERLLVCPPGHPLSGTEVITLDELANHPILMAPPGNSFRDAIDAEAADAGIELQAQAEIDGMRLLASMAFQGFGAALVPASATPGWFAGEHHRVRVEGLSRRQVGLALPRRTTPSAPTRIFETVLHEVLTTRVPDQPGLTLTLS